MFIVGHSSNMYERRPLMSLMVCLLMMVSILHLFFQQQEEQQTTEYFYPSVRQNQFAQNNNTSIISSSTSLNNPAQNFNNNYNINNVGQFNSPIDSDYNRLIDLKHFQFLKSHNSCRSTDNSVPLVVILVHSAPENLSKRRTIRETWGRKDKRSLLIFLLGAVRNTNLQNSLERESNLYGDIVQGSFVDSYRNMTYKHVMGFKWFVYYCQQAHFVLKTDDDILVNSPLLYEYLSLESPISSTFALSSTSKRLILCDKITNSKVKRTYRSKWRVSYTEYEDKFYKSYCPGFAIIFSSDVVKDLYQKAQESRYFWIDDVHITGNIRETFKIPITTVKDIFLSTSQQNDILSGNIDANSIKFLFGRPNLIDIEIRQLWNALLKSRNEIE